MILASPILYKIQNRKITKITLITGALQELGKVTEIKLTEK